MKYLLLILVISCLHPAWSQYRNEYLNVKNIYGTTYPVPDNETVYTGEMEYYDFNWISKQDSIGNWITEKYESEITERNSKIDPYELAFQVNPNDFWNIAPSLDVLPDGRYIQYYKEIPYFHGDTIYFRTDIVACIFELKNNLPHGIATWYYPNGLIKQQGNYDFGIKEGTWFYQQSNYHLRKSKKKLSYTTYQFNYSKGLKSGAARYDYFFQGESKHDRDYHFIIQTFYKDNQLDGDYISTINGKLNSKGSYSNGTQSGTWETYIEHATNPNKTQLLTRCTYNHDSLVTFSSGFLFTERVPKTKHTMSFEGQFGSQIKISTYTNSFSSIFGTNDFEDEEKPFKFIVPKCMDITWSQNILYNPLNEKHSYFPGETAGKIDSTFINVEDLMHQCGKIFKYKGIYESYHLNGQLKVSYDFDHPETLYKSLQYYPNGNVQHRVDRLNDTSIFYMQYFYDTLGTLVGQVKTNRFGFVNETIYPITEVFQNGKKFYSYNDNWYWNSKGYNISKHQDSIELNQILNNSLTTISSAVYYPKEFRKVAFSFDPSINYLEKSVTIVDSLYSTSTCYTEIKLEPFVLVSSCSKRLSEDSIFLNLLNSSHRDSLQTSCINRFDVINPDSMYLTLNKINYTGKITIEIGSNFSMKKLKNGWKIQVQKEKMNVALKLFSCQDKLSFLRYNFYNPWNKTLTIEKVELTYLNGKPFGTQIKTLENNTSIEIVRIEKNMYESKLYETKLNYPDYGQEKKKNDTKKQELFLSKYYYKSPRQEIWISLNAEQDTLSYTTTSINGNVVKEKSIPSYKRDLTQRTTEDGKLVELTISSENRTKGKYFLLENRYQTYYLKTGREHESYYFNEQKQLDSIIIRDTFGLISSRLLCESDKIKTLHKYKDNDLIFKIQFKDSLYWNLSEIPYEFSNSHFQGNLVTEDNYSGNLEQYHKGTNQIMATGTIKRGFTVGVWQFYEKNGQLAYSIHSNGILKFNYNRDTINFPKTKQRGIIIDAESFSLCSEGINLDFYNISFLNSEFDSIYHINYYLNGNIMNEGWLIQGKPSGFWKCYHPDGSLYAIGSYEAGNREGRWISGDLSKVKYTGEMCLDTSSEAYKNIIETIDVELIFYHEGNILERNFYRLSK